MITYKLSDAALTMAPSSYQFAILNALQDKHVYAGTIPAKVKARRRARNRVARASRRRNRA